MGSGQFRDGLSTRDAPGLQQYRSLSGWSVSALLLGLVSVVALAHPAAWLIPLSAILCGVWALRRIRRHTDALMGARLATTGLLLGLFFLSWAPTSYFGDRWLIYRTSRQFAEEWLTAVFQGQLSKAYQATLPVRERQPAGTALDEYYENNPLRRAERDAYFNDGIPKQLAELQGRGRFVFDRHPGVTVDRAYILTSPRFFIYREGEDDPLLHLQMEIVREEDDEGVYWILPRMADAEEIDQNLQIRRQWRQPTVLPR
ncbi:MAG TPA: hypothetical protein VFZ51_10150 [Woeseiaceae bacterium]